MIRCATFFAIFIAIPVFAQDIVIDDMSDSQSLIIAVGAGSSVSSFAAGSQLGGERDLDAEVVAGSIASAEVTGGVLVVSCAAASTCNFFVSWDGGDSQPAEADLDPAGLGGVDLTLGGTVDVISLDVDSADTTGTYTIDIASDGSNASSIAVPVPITAATSRYSVPFSSFSTSAGIGADFSNVGAIALAIDGTELDASISLVAAQASLSAEQTDALIIDSGSNGIVDVGDTLRYTVVVDNPDDAFDASRPGVVFSTSVNALAALVVGSVTTSQGTVTSGNTGGDTSLSVDVGTIDDAASVTITYDIILTTNPGMPVNLCQQGTLSSDDLAGGLSSDDPDDATGTSDPTCTTSVVPVSLLEMTIE